MNKPFFTGQFDFSLGNAGWSCEGEFNNKIIINSQPKQVKVGF